MTFISIPFAALFIVTITLLWLCKTKKQQHIILLLSNIFFYSWWDIKFLVLLFFQIIVCYLVALGIAHQKKCLKPGKWFMILGVSVSLIVLGFFKYFHFFVSSFGSTNLSKKFSSITIILPIGISFYTFLAISYVVDVYRQKAEANRNFLEVALYLSFFPQLLSGPITRAKDFLPQLRVKHNIQKENIEISLQIFLFGVIKKYLIANRLAVYTDTVFAVPNAYSGISLLCATLAYSIQLYCDFSGYSDMAIGVAKAMGFTLTPNFNMPYLSKNPTEFWKKWHISLSAWLQEYIYISLGGNRKGTVRTYLNLMITMFLGGFWHGADWKFIFWGSIHGLALVIHKLFLKICNKYELHSTNTITKKATDIISTIATYLFVCLCWIFFKANSLENALHTIIRILTGSSGIQYIFVFFPIYFILIITCHIMGIIKNKGTGYYPLLDLNKFSSKVTICIIILLIAAFGYWGNSAFIYSQF